jgi:thiol:disulfide interchange protein
MRTAIAFLFLFSTAFAQIDEQSNRCDHQETYEAAYKQAFLKKKPLLVMLTATWCAPCQSYKSDVLEPMDRANEFDGFVFVKLDYDQNKDVANRIMEQTGNRRLPQLVTYAFDGTEWKRDQLFEKRPIDEVRKLLARTKKVLWR